MPTPHPSPNVLPCPLPPPPCTGVIPGSKFEVPFQCPLDHVFDLEYGWAKELPVQQHGPNVDFRWDDGVWGGETRHPYQLSCIASMWTQVWDDGVWGGVGARTCCPCLCSSTAPTWTSGGCSLGVSDPHVCSSDETE